MGKSQPFVCLEQTTRRPVITRFGPFGATSMISDAGRRLANSMFKATRGRSGKSLFNSQAGQNRMLGGAQRGGELPVLEDMLPPAFKPQAPQGMNLMNITRKYGG